MGSVSTRAPRAVIAARITAGTPPASATPLPSSSRCLSIVMAGEPYGYRSTIGPVTERGVKTLMLSYAHGARADPLLGETIGDNLDRTIARLPDCHALIHC